MKMRPATEQTVGQVDYALFLLRQARFYLRDADCPKATARVRAAIKSTEGAVRHVERRARHASP